MTREEAEQIAKNMFADPKYFHSAVKLILGELSPDLHIKEFWDCEEIAERKVLGE